MASNTYNPTRPKLSQVTVIGDAGVDAIIQLPKSQDQATSFNIIRPILSPGGTAGNTSLSLARLGHDVTMFFAISVAFCKPIKDLACPGESLPSATIDKTSSERLNNLSEFAI